MSLYVVATPIGNLGDITFRAIETLKKVSLIACEDTRYTRKLLSHYDIHTPVTSYYEYNKIRKLDFLLEQLTNGKDIALVSDSGTPGISDPGFLIISEAVKNKIQVISIPGPAAVISALVTSGLPTDSFVFEGFLPRKKGKLKKALTELATLQRTIVFYESPYRITATLKVMKEAIGNQYIVIARELTKHFEEVLRGDLDALIPRLEAQPLKGEMVVLFNPSFSNPEKTS
ncbi:MAG: 16S rRNA (cytidine(1402)-2'-O)-methyltransferase [bacterium]|nr:16S rRNA (cytidine(1402)-2'-O)-methyltransferase [bacterium]MDD5756269.1 16S rRNA (cytidine(1402)-2'-O)-methyltransferase [bacterium]